jgi:hypothetical protein
MASIEVTGLCFYRRGLLPAVGRQTEKTARFSSEVS